MDTTIQARHIPLHDLGIDRAYGVDSIKCVHCHCHAYPFEK